MRRILLLVIMLSLAYSADAQSRRKRDTINLCEPGHYVVFDIGGGIHTLTYQLANNGLYSPGPGFMVRGGYRYFFNEHWGIGTDINLKSFMTSGTINYTNAIDDAYDQDPFGENAHQNYKHLTVYNNLKERQKQMAVSIPIAAYYQNRIDRQWKIGGGAGILYQFTDISNKYIIKDGFVETKGYYEEWECLLERMTQHNFYQRSDLKGDNIKHSSIGMYLEGNILYYINPRLSLDFGLYFHKGFGYQKESEGKLLFDPDCQDGGNYDDKYNGMLQSDLVGKANPFAIGVMAGIRYKLQITPSQRVKDEEPPKKPEEPIIRDTLPDDAPSIIIEDKPVVEVDTVPAKPDAPLIVDTIPTKPDLPFVKDTIPLLIVDTYESPAEIEIDFEKYRRVSVTFTFNDTIVKLNAQQSKMFDDIAKIMNEQQNLTIHIVGHTCNIGTLEQNMYVGQKRADNCKYELMRRGISGVRITTESKAFLEPLVPNTHEANRRKNRRIEFIIK